MITKAFHAALLLLAGCSTVAIGGPTRVSHSMLSCAEAMRAARQTVQRLGYSVSDVRAAEPGKPGEVTGSKGGYDSTSKNQTIRVAVSCSDSGADFEASTNDDGMGQLGFASTFDKTLAAEIERKTERPRMESEVTRGLIFKAVPLRSAESQQVLGFDLPAAGVTAVRIEIDNRSDRRYRFDPEQVVLHSVQGKRETPLTVAAAAQRAGSAAAAAPSLQQHAIAATELGPGQKATGYLYFPASTYRRARVTMIDVASDEPEGFSLEF